MIKIKIEKNKLNKPVFKMHFDEEDIKKHVILKRIFFEAKKKSGVYNYEIPMKFCYPVLNNLDLKSVYIDTRSHLTFFEFSDEFEEVFNYSTKIDSKYMKKWREFDCPNIYIIEIDLENRKIEKRISFKKLKISI